MASVSELTEFRPRSCWLEIDLDALVHNLERVRRHRPSGSRILAVVKADAYGHGAEMVVRTLAENDVEYFGVATLEEALELRGFGVQSNLLIMGHLATFNVDRILEHDLTPLVFSYRLLRALNEEGKRRNTVVPVHVKVDTGMGRLGLLPEDLDDYLEELGGLDHVRLEGVATHLAQAGEDREYTREQMNEFQAIRDRVRRAGLDPEYWHAMNSAAVFSEGPAGGNMVRPGISLYGYPPHDGVDPSGLEPIMQVKTKMADYKRLPAGKGISYGRIDRPEEPVWVGVLPLGYADGYSRRMTGRAHVLKRGRRCPVLGRICMDMTMIELDAEDDPEETVTVMGRDNGRELWANKLAAWSDTIPYEILSNFSSRLPRLYFRGGEPIAVKTEREVRRLNDAREDPSA